MSSVTRSLFVVDSSPSPIAVRLACVALVASLAGCSTIEGWFSADKVDYKNGSHQTGGLEVPPDLTQLAKDGRAQIQGGTVSAAALERQQQQQGTTGATPAAKTSTAANGRSVALKSVGDASIERSGKDRWVHTTLTPEQVWPILTSFWKENGFEIASSQADIGMMETNWAENRSKAPQDFLSRNLGKIFEGLFSSGERDMYRARVERDDKGGTDVFITHHGKEEVYTTTQHDQMAWQDRTGEPLLEAQMLSRLMLKLGGKSADTTTMAAGDTPDAATGDSAIATAAVPTSTLPDAVKARPLSEVPDSLQVNEGFERAWRRVGQSLDRHGFTIEDRDRTMGMFFLRYADPAQAGKDEPNFFQRLFTSDKAPEPIRYRVLVKANGNVSTVSILDNKGQQQTTPIAKGILNLLMDDLR